MICPHCKKEAVETETNLWGIHKSLSDRYLFCPWCGWFLLGYEEGEKE